MAEFHLRTIIKLSLGIVLVVVGVCSFFWTQSSNDPAGPEVAEVPAAAREFDKHPLPVAPFQLTDSNGRAFKSQQLRGNVWIVSFFFSTCAGPCTVLNRQIADLQGELDQDVVFVSITVNPQVDTPERLREYAKSFTADEKRWLFLTGKIDKITEIARSRFLVAAGGNSEDPLHSISHSDRLILIDKEQRVRGYFRSQDELEMQLLKKRVQSMLAE